MADTFAELAIKSLRKVLLAFNSKETDFDCIDDPDLASERIKALLNGEDPCMISRFGSGELYVVRNYVSVSKGRDIKSYLSGKTEQWWWNQKGIDNLVVNAGFFPGDLSSVEKFCNMMVEDARQIDFLGSWIKGESAYVPHLHHQDKALLRLLEPFWAEKPWTKVLEGRRVLVVHPFADLIDEQYCSKRSKLFQNQDILPPFDLVTLRAVQSIGGNASGYSSWFDALDYMKAEVDKVDYDIALIGCGAYGLPLAAHIKRSGKKAVHLGGALQLLFGIIGKRWEDPMYGVKEWGIPQGYYSSLINEYWVRPGAELRPSSADKVEEACYW